MYTYAKAISFFANICNPCSPWVGISPALGTGSGSTRNSRTSGPPVVRTWIAFIPYLFFGKRNCTWNLADQFVVRSGCTAFPKHCAYIFTGNGPKWTIFPAPPPTGAVHLWSRVDSQFAVMMGEEVRYHP